MKILIAVASKHDSTGEIGRSIAETVGARGHGATVTKPDLVEAVHTYDAIIVGSAVYAGHWMKTAVEFVDRFSEHLAQRPVWLFSSGPIGDPPKPEEDPVDVAHVLAATGAHDHRLFAGKLDKSKLSFPERAIVGALRAPYGDFRDWDEIGRWAEVIADHLTSSYSDAGKSSP